METQKPNDISKHSLTKPKHRRLLSIPLRRENPSPARDDLMVAKQECMEYLSPVRTTLMETQEPNDISKHSLTKTETSKAIAAIHVINCVI